MSHEWDSGWLNEPAWHELGNVRGQGDYPDRQPDSIDELRRWAGIEWEPVEGPLYIPSASVLIPAAFAGGVGGQELDDELAAVLGQMEAVSVQPRTERLEVSPTFSQIEGWKAIVRSDNGYLLNCARDSYGLFTNTEHCALFEAVMGEIGKENLTVEGMMSLKLGAQVVIVAKLTDTFTLPGDDSPAFTYATFGNAHDGSGALSVFPTNIRVVCNNTWTFAKEGAEQSWGGGITVRHTKSVKDRVEQAKKILTGLGDARAQYIELMEELIGIKFPPKLEERFVVDFIPAPPETLISDRVANNIDEARAAVRMILHGEHVAGAGIGGTAYGCVMAATEYLDHVRKARSAQTKFRRQFLRQEPLKEKALAIVREIAEELV